MAQRCCAARSGVGCREPPLTTMLCALTRATRGNDCCNVADAEQHCWLNRHPSNAGDGDAEVCMARGAIVRSRSSSMPSARGQAIEDAERVKGHEDAVPVFESKSADRRPIARHTHEDGKLLGQIALCNDDGIGILMHRSVMCARRHCGVVEGKGGAGSEEDWASFFYHSDKPRP